MKEKTALQKILTLKGLTRKQAAALCGVPISTLTFHCLGLREMSLKAATNYAQTLGVPLEWLSATLEPTKPMEASA